MGRANDKKWTDEQVRTVVRAMVVQKVSAAAAGRLVQDADGRPMPRSTAREKCDRYGPRLALEDDDAARQQLDRTIREMTARAVALATGKLNQPQAKELAGLKIAAATLRELRSALGPARPAPKAKPTEPEAERNGHAPVDEAVARILGG